MRDGAQAGRAWRRRTPHSQKEGAKVSHPRERDLRVGALAAMIVTEVAGHRQPYGVAHRQDGTSALGR
jgi:hypothetical protein